MKKKNLMIFSDVDKKKYKTVRELLSKFTYETRTSSQEFCDKLCAKDYRDKSVTIAEYIKNSTWFYSEWIHDPTINAMLISLTGVQSHEESQNSRIKKDAIEFALCIAENQYSTEYVHRLEWLLKSVVFMRLKLENMRVSDDLYIKLNARGKALTDFENFKSDLDYYIDKTKNNDLAVIKSSIDSIWTDVIWNSVEDKQNNFDGNINQIFYLFINRFFLNNICIKNDISASDFDYSADNSSKTSDQISIYEAFSYFYGRYVEKNKPTDDENTVIYSEFKPYETVIDLHNDLLIRLNRVFINYQKNSDEVQKCISTYIPEFRFIPKYNEVNNISQIERIYFLAICLYLENEKFSFNETEFSRWLRVAYNLANNAGIDGIGPMVNCMRLVCDIRNNMNANNTADVYAFFNDYNYDYSGNANEQLKLQLEEEIQKAKLVIADTDIETELFEAERALFFKGCIRFLYADENGKTLKTAVRSTLNNRVKNAHTLFSEESIKVETLVTFLSLFKGFDEIENCRVYNITTYHDRNACWKKDILCSDNPEVMKNIRILLDKDAIALEAEINDIQVNAAENYKKFIKSKFIANIVGGANKYRYVSAFNAIHNKGSNIGYIYVDNNNIKFGEELEKIPNLSINEGVIHSEGFFNGLKIPFTYKNKSFIWDRGKNEIQEFKHEKQIGKIDIDFNDSIENLLAKI